MAYELIGNLGKCIARLSSDDGESSSSKFQRLSAVVQRFNSILLHDSFLWLLITQISGLSSFMLLWQF